MQHPVPLLRMGRPRFLVLLMVHACLMLASPPARAQVGMVLTVEGQVNVISGKPECSLRYGLDIEEGDTVRTGDKSWAVLSLMDGAKITVRPSTEVRVDAYRFVDAGAERQNHATMTLARGSLRVVTGAIARSRNSGYQVRTPDLAMELRGTDHDVTYVVPQFTPGGDAAAGTYGKTYAGESVMRHAAGDITLRDGQAAFAPSLLKAPPRLLTFEPWFFSVHASIDRRAAAIVDALSGPNLQ